MEVPSPVGLLQRKHVGMLVDQQSGRHCDDHRQRFVVGGITSTKG